MKKLLLLITIFVSTHAFSSEDLVDYKLLSHQTTSAFSCAAIIKVKDDLIDNSDEEFDRLFNYGLYTGTTLIKDFKKGLISDEVVDELPWVFHAFMYQDVNEYFMLGQLYQLIVSDINTDKLPLSAILDIEARSLYNENNCYVIGRDSNVQNQEPNLEDFDKLIKEEQKKLDELIARRLAEQEAFAKDQYNRLLTLEVQAEQDLANSLISEDQLNTLKNAYLNNITARVFSNWNYQGAEDDWGCEVYVLQDREGNVKAVDVQNCNTGDSAKARAFKDSIERAIYRTSPLPSAPDDAVFDREILFYFQAD